MSFVKYEPQGSIAYLIIDREKALNALNTQVLSDLDAAIDATNRFYLALGFGEFEVFPTLWDEWNPCQIYVMSLK